MSSTSRTVTSESALRRGRARIPLNVVPSAVSGGPVKATRREATAKNRVLPPLALVLCLSPTGGGGWRGGHR